ncbi:MAG TPA: hypothetical protein VGJ84_22720 [Polyangiaceae bacterium]|jgi:hypothetical protein
MTDRLKPGSLKTASDLFQKVRRDAALLDGEVNSDRFFNFVVTAYSLIDWIRHDPSVPASAKAQGAIDGLYNDQWLRLCGDAATGAKHFTLTHRTPTADKVSVASGWGVGRFGKGPYGVGEERITVHLPGGPVYGALELVAGVLKVWETFFTNHGIPI